MTRQNTSFTVRDAGLQDAAAIAQIGRTVFGNTFGYSLSPNDLDTYLTDSYSEEVIFGDLQDSNKLFLVAYSTVPGSSDERVLGFAQLTKGTTEPCISSEVAASSIELQRLYVRQECHGSGLGRALMDQSQDIARSWGFKTMWLGVWEDNFKAQKVYGKLGFTRIGEHDFKMGDCIQTDWIMIKNL